MTDLLSHQSFYLVGLKGVAMTSLAQCLIDAGKKVTGSDVTEEFVTQPILDQLDLVVAPLTSELPSDIDCLIYTAAHQGPQNPQVLAAQQAGPTVLSHAEALADLFNQKKGVAVCGVGGKSTVSAMITWVLEQLAQTKPDQYQHQSFSVGVGSIIGLARTGQWIPDSELFIAEADDYVTDPSAPSRGQEIMPRFSFLRPHLTVCTNLKYDHPDVYRDFDHTQQVFKSFFQQIQPGGSLIVNGDDPILLKLAQEVVAGSDIKLISYGSQPDNTIQLIKQQAAEGKNTATIRADQEYQIELKIPGQFNIENAMAAAAACHLLGVSYQDSFTALAQFRSTKRRFEYIGQKNGVEYYDDYAHHPHEVAAVIKAIKAWRPDQRLVAAFQPHTFSRTKQLLPEFVTALSQADQVVMIDIFSSAREQQDPTISSDTVCQAVMADSSISCTNLQTLANLAQFCQTELKPNDVLITIGAGDIYHLHDLI